MSNIFPVRGLAVTTEEIAAFAREKIASLTPEEAQERLEILEEQGSDSDEENDALPKTAEDQEAFGALMYAGFNEATRRFNELTTDQKLNTENALEKTAAEIADFEAETDALRADLDPTASLREAAAEKLAELDPDYALKRLRELGYVEKSAEDEEESDGSEGVEDEDAEEASEEDDAEQGS